jgi:cytochrome c-type biogenesis protein CcmH
MSIDPRAWRCTGSTVRNVRLAALSLLAALLVAAPAQGAVSFTDVEDEVMCTVCGTPLNLAPADAPFAMRERAYIRRLIAQGESKQEIKDALARQYGDEVLGLPKNDGFNLAAYLVPVLGGLAAAALIVFALARWRRPRRAGPTTPAPGISSADSRRLDEDMARYD